jgi:integrase
MAPAGLEGNQGDNMSRRKTKKKRIANQIFQDPWGFEARIKAKGRLYTQRFDPDTPLSTMQRWQLDAKDALGLGLEPVKVPQAASIQRSRQHEMNRLRQAQQKTAAMTAIPLLNAPAAAATGATLETRIESYFPQIAGRSCYKADRSHLRAWIHAVGADGVELGAKAPAAITTADLNVIIGNWRSVQVDPATHKRAVRRVTVTAYARDGKAIRTYDRKTPTTGGAVVAIKTVRHRCRLLREFLIAENVPVNAIDAAKIPRAEKAHPVGVDIKTIRAVAVKLAAVPEWADTYARYAVLATTAQRPTQLMRAEPADVKLTGAKLWVVRSAKGAPAHTVTLNEEMIQAFQLFVAAKAWGPYDTSLHAKRLRACGWPAAIRPYNARHSVAQDALHDFDVDLNDVQGLLGHTTPEMTRRAYASLAITRQRHISDKLVGRFKGVFGPRLQKGKKTGTA